MMLLRTFVPSQETYANYTRPLTYEAIKRVLSFYGLNDGTQVFYNGEAEITKLVGSNSTDQTRTDLYTDGVFRGKIYAVVQHQRSTFNTDYGNSRRDLTEQPIWLDLEHGIRVSPEYEGRLCRVELNAHFPSRIKAQTFVNQIEMLRAQQMTDFNFNAVVHKVFNEGVLGLIEHVHAIKQHWEGDNCPELTEWFKSNAKVSMTTISNKAGNNQVLAVPYRMRNMGIQLEGSAIQLAQKSNIFGKYEVSVPFYFHFQEFMGWRVEYPLNVYQTEIDDEFIPTRDEGFKEFSIRNNVELTLANSIWTDSRKGLPPYYHVFPDHDPWRVPFYKWEMPVLQARISLPADPDNRLLCNMFEIPDFEWNEVLSRWALRNREKIFSDTNSPLVIRVWSGDTMVRPNQLSMDAGGNILINREPTLKNTHRLVISVNYGVRDWKEEFWEDLDQNQEDLPVLDMFYPFTNWKQYTTPPAYPVQTNLVVNQAPKIKYLKPQLKTIKRDIGSGDDLLKLDFNTYMINLGVKAYTPKEG